MNQKEGFEQWKDKIGKNIEKLFNQPAVATVGKEPQKKGYQAFNFPAKEPVNDTLQLNFNAKEL